MSGLHRFTSEERSALVSEVYDRVLQALGQMHLEAHLAPRPTAYSPVPDQPPTTLLCAIRRAIEDWEESLP